MVSRKLPEACGHYFPTQITFTATAQMIVRQHIHKRDAKMDVSLCSQFLVKYRSSEEFSMMIAPFQPQGCKIHCMNADFVFNILYFLI